MIGTGIGGVGAPASGGRPPARTADRQSPSGFDDAVDAAGGHRGGGDGSSPTETADDGDSHRPPRTGHWPLDLHHRDAATGGRTGTGGGKDDTGHSPADKRHEKHDPDADAAVAAMPVTVPPAAIEKPQAGKGGKSAPADKEAAATATALSAKADGKTPPQAIDGHASPAAAAAKTAAATDAATPGSAKGSAPADQAASAGSVSAASADAARPAQAGRLSALAGLHARLSNTDTTEKNPSSGKDADGKSGSRAAAAAGSAKERIDLASKEQSSDAAKDSDTLHGNATRMAGGTGSAALPAGLPGPASAGSLSQSLNVASIVDGISAQTDWTAALAKVDAAGRDAAGTSVNALKLELHPAEHGNETATLRVTGDRLAIDLQVHTAEAYRQLSTGNDSILDKLKGHGYAVESITVRHAAPLRANAANQPAQQQQSGSGAFTPNQGGQGAFGGSGQHGGGSGQGSGAGRPSSGFSETLAHGGDRPRDPVAGSRRPGGVYV